MKNLINLLASAFITGGLVLSYVYTLPQLEVFILTVMSMIMIIAAIGNIFFMLQNHGYDQGHLNEEQLEKLYGKVNDISMFVKCFGRTMSVINITMFVMLGHPVFAAMYLFLVLISLSVMSAKEKRCKEYIGDKI
jgi:uncharacterized membrane protein YdfJ with MMPL/SSD domain|tara:strand:+ start:1458 stop:1862 length:405 start_codon:yes stop_codon:yes gene_type:complete